MAVAPTDYILKAYMSETDAIEDTNALYVTSSTDGTLSNATCQSGTTTDDAGNTTYFHFYIFEKYWFRIESNELSTAFEIDWDDGENNSAEKSNTTLLTYENPRFIGITPKIFTKHGAHYPLLRAKNVEGFWSKWYTPYSTSNDLTTVNDDMKYFRAQYDSGLNTAYTVSMETINKPRIPILVPANKPPTGVLKIDRKQVFSGIDNVSFPTTSHDLTVDGTLKVTCDNTTRDDVVVRVIYENNANSIQEVLLSISGDGGGIVDDSSVAASVANVTRVLRIELLDCRDTTVSTVTNKLASGERLYLYNDAPLAHRADPVVGYVSNGNPLITLEEPGNYVVIDGTESSTKAQNVSIGKYYFDTDKLIFTTGSISTYAGTQVQSYSGGPDDWHRLIVEVDTSHRFTDNFNTRANIGAFYNGAQKVSYSLDFKHDLLDEHSRILPQTRLIRLQVRDTGDTTDVDTVADLLRRSAVEHFRKRDYYDGDPEAAATGSITITNYAELNAGDKINLVATDGTNYDFTVGDQSSVAGTWESTTSNSQTATNLMNVINTSSGPSGTRFTASLSSSTVVTVAQAEVGADGNTTITLTDSNSAGMSRSNFSGGADTIANNFVQRRPDSLKSFSQFIMTRDLSGNDTNPDWHDNSDENFYTSGGLSAPATSGSILSGRDDTTNAVLTDTQVITDTPRHFWFMAKDKIFDRLHFRTAFIDMTGINPPVHDDLSNPTSPTFPSIELQIWYPAYKDATRVDIIWKPLKYVDGTRYNKNRGTSLSRSGVVSWDVPEDWLKTKHGGKLDYSMGGSDFPDSDNSNETDGGIEDTWDVDSYGLIIGFGGDRTGVSDANVQQFAIQSCMPFNNSHSQVVEVVDPTCISLNEFAMAQSISFTRKGKFQKIENRLGTAEIRKIGVSGGAVKFGGLDLRGDPNAMRKKMYQYQKDAVPVYIDVTHRNDEFTRFFGVITDMSEDHPTGAVIPKFALSMQISKIAMCNSSGGIISDGLVALGGEIDDKPDYIGFGGQKA